jgi:hypothetical protein
MSFFHRKDRYYHARLRQGRAGGLSVLHYPDGQCTIDKRTVTREEKACAKFK